MEVVSQCHLAISSCFGYKKQQNFHHDDYYGLIRADNVMLNLCLAEEQTLKNGKKLGARFASAEQGPQTVENDRVRERRRLRSKQARSS